MEQKALPVLTIDETSDGQKLETVLGQTVEICLKENPTTGFRWRIAQAGEPTGTLAGNPYGRGANVAHDINAGAK